MDQPGKVANPAGGQLNRENNILLSPCVPENLVSRDGFSRLVPRQPAHLHYYYYIIIISAHKSDLSNPWTQTQASLSIPSLHPKNTNKRREIEEKITDEKTSPDLIGGEGKK